MASQIKYLKFTTVGDGNVGKTCILLSYTTKEFPKDNVYAPAIFDNYESNITVDGLEYNMALWDTAGQEDYERLRPLSYPNTACFLLCYSVANRASYDNIKIKWLPEIRHRQEQTPIILIATKIDLRDEASQNTITTAGGRKLRDEIKAARYLECSAKTGEGLDVIFEEAVRSSVSSPVNSNPKKRPVNNCILL